MSPKELLRVGSKVKIDMSKQGKVPSSMESIRKEFKTAPRLFSSGALFHQHAAGREHQGQAFPLPFPQQGDCWNEKPKLTFIRVVILYFETSGVAPSTFITHLANFPSFFPFIYFCVSLVFITVSLIRWLNPYLARAVVRTLSHNRVNSIMFCSGSAYNLYVLKIISGCINKSLICKPWALSRRFFLS